MESRTGNLSINSENMLPIIKKWLYSDHDIFVRELISNGCDAISKLHKLEIMGEYQYPDDHKDSIQVIVDPDEKTVQFVDTGLGMTEAEAVHWACDGSSEYTIGPGSFDQIGTKITLHLSEDCVEFSNEYRMREVLERYCSFMPVEIFLSRANAPQEYETIDESDLKDDDVVVEHIHEDAKTEEQDDGNGGKKTVEISPARDRVKINKRPVSISDTHPLWAKHPNDCTDEEYKDFYRKVFNDYREPLFWIHLNMDYPFNLKGILYFPKINTEYDSIEATIKLYNNQVFIADNIKEVVPEYMMLLKGVIDCPDFPLNVSRSALQNDGFVKKISDYISKKVSDKLSGMCKTDRENYEKYWDDISPFIKYGCLKDSKFNDRMKDFILYKDLDGKFFTLKEYLEQISKKAEGTEETEKAPEGEKTDAETVDFSENPEELKEEKAEADSEADAEKDSETDAPAEEKKEEKTVIYYVTDENQQGQYIRMFRENGMDAVILRHTIDSPFISHVEQQDEKIRFERIDADVTGSMKEEADEDQLKADTELLSGLFKKALSKEKLTVKVEKLKDAKISSMLTLNEEGRRMQDMMRMYSSGGMDMSMFAPEETLTLNQNNSLVKYLLAHKEGEHTDLFAKQLYDLASLANAPLQPEAMTAFIERSNEIMMLLAK